MNPAATPCQNENDRGRTEVLSRERRRPPAEVPGYVLERFLGRGTFGEVWVALKRNGGYRVAIKFVLGRAGLDFSLMAREVDKLRALKGDRYVVQLEDIGWKAEPPYFAMEYVEGRSLEEWLEQGPMPVEAAVSLFREIAVGLNHAHNKGILHCDLKPANILLDQDLSPRLADFGQARLAEDHNPALGTWFYMAPEQANLSAEPDARWDVYALGVVLYRMLTGQTPYQTPEIEAELQKPGVLEERLCRYRKTILKAPQASAHRRVKGIDRLLVDIVDRCLSRDPTKRFANVQAVLTALNARAMTRAWRPLLIMGGLGPVLLLVLLGLLAWGLIATTVSDARDEITTRAQAGNHVIAQLAARQVEAKILQRWQILTQQAARPELLDLLRQARGQPEESPQRQKLRRWLDDRQAHFQFMRLASSWFLVDAESKMLAVSPLDTSRKSLDKFFWHRDYFHGRGFDMDPDAPRPADLKPVDHPHLSVVFKSSADGHPLMVVFTVPIQAAHSPPEGLLAMGVRLGEFTELWTDTPGEHKVVTLVQTRPDIEDPHARPGRVLNDGLIVEHKQLRDLRRKGQEVSEYYLPPRLTAELRQLREERRQQLEGKVGAGEDSLALIADYHDPLGEQGGYYQGSWLAAAEPVVFQTRILSGGKETAKQLIDPGWVVLAQERSETVTAPVQRMQRQLLFLILITLGLVVLGVAALWGVVLVGLNQASRSRLSHFVRKQAGLSASPALKTVVSAGPDQTAASKRRRAQAGAAPTSPGTPVDERAPGQDFVR